MCTRINCIVGVVIEQSVFGTHKLMKKLLLWKGIMLVWNVSLYMRTNCFLGVVIKLFVFGKFKTIINNIIEERYQFCIWLNLIASYGGFIDRCDTKIFNIHLFFWLSVINKN